LDLFRYDPQGEMCLLTVSIFRFETLETFHHASLIHARIETVVA
jgi:hypothetical protein